MKRAWLITCIICIATVLLGASPAAAAPDMASLNVPQVHAKAAALIDVKSGRLLFSENGDEPMRIASLTKIMTAIVAIENGNLADKVKVSSNAYGTEGSSIYLRLGEEMSLEHLLYGLMLRSGNDAAVAIAEHVGGSLDGFTYLMNKKAQELGMNHSQFKNPNGLDVEGHYASANDMALLTAYALHNPVFKEIVKTKVKTVPNPYEKWDHRWRNKNKMLSLYEGADGVKTGYTKLSSRCLVSSATRNGQQLAVVTLNDPDDWLDHTLLLNYGFQNYPLKEIVSKGTLLQNSLYAAGRSFYYPLSEQEAGLVSHTIVLHKKNTLDYRFGEMGKMFFELEGQEIGSIPLYNKESPLLQREESTFFRFKASKFETASDSSYFDILRALLASLFSLGPAGDADD